jgi:digalactosyldiacylglycerol synthase
MTVISNVNCWGLQVDFFKGLCLMPWITDLHHDVQFSTEKRSILAAGDISEFIPDQEADVAVLEEPEHLTWYYHGKRWTDKFQHVVGVVHTNYLEYVKREKNGKLQAFLLKYVNNWVVRIYCTKVVHQSCSFLFVSHSQATVKDQCQVIP